VASADAELAAVKARLRHAAALAQAAAWHEERRVSRALHGPVQNAVVSAAMCIEAGDRDGAERLLIRALGHLDDDQRERGTGDALDDLVESWSGLCDVRVSVPAAIAQRIDADPPLASAVIDICTEACSNAVRHGGARGVSIQATDAGDAVALDITDDGAPTGISPDPGLGTAMLDGVALEWQREREGSRTVLSALLPWPGAPAADSHNPRRPCAPSSPNR
jgi:signal transduction histidine kinase